MGYYCTVPQCTSLAGKTKNVKFHRFPRDVTMADKWNLILKRGKPYTKYSKVCSLHFTQTDYNVTTMGQWKTLSKDAVPSQNLPKLNPDGTVMVIRKSRTVKYREGKKDDSDKMDTKSWQSSLMGHSAHPHLPNTPDTPMAQDLHDNSILAYRLQTLGSIASNVAPQHPTPTHGIKPRKQDAFMQTDPVLNEDDDTQPNNSYSEVSDKSYSSEMDQYNQSYPKEPSPYLKDAPQYPKEPTPYPREGTPYKDTYLRDTVQSYKDSPYPKDSMYSKDTFNKEGYSKETTYEPKDYRKASEDYIPQTNEEYNKEAEKYALERKSHNGYDPKDYQKQILENGYQKLPVPDMYSFEKYNRDAYYQNGYADSAELLRNQQHNLQILQEQHRTNENQNFFNENHIKQEIDISGDDDKFLYERSKEQIESSQYAERRLQHHRILDHLQHQVKQEPEVPVGTEGAMVPQSSPYYSPSASSGAGGAPSGSYYEALPRPGAELLIAKQNALAAHTQLWQNTMKRPFYYSESPHFNGPQLLHRYDDIPRILQ